ncbi:MAG: helix-turn-helix transcriptional regulator [Planctomycetota bacterium]
MLEELQLSLPTGRGVAIYPPGATFGPRQMRDYEFVWLMEGDAEYRWGATTVAAPEGSIVLCRPSVEGASDEFRWDPVKSTRHAYFHFDVLSLPPDWPPPTQWPLVRPAVEGDVLRPLFRHLLTWVKGPDATAPGATLPTPVIAVAPATVSAPAGGSAGASVGGNTGGAVGSGAAGDATVAAPEALWQIAHRDEMLCRLTMMHMLTAFVSGDVAAQEAPPERLPEAVERTLKFIQERMDADAARPIDLPELAGAAFVTPEHLCRVFKAATGRTPVETVRLARLDRAVVLLSRSNYSVGEIAHLCGFASPFHFSRRFKEAFGLPPKAVRKQIEAGQIPPLPRLLRWAQTTRMRAARRF